jgi:hypothetical protein
VVMDDAVVARVSVVSGEPRHAVHEADIIYACPRQSRRTKRQNEAARCAG